MRWNIECACSLVALKQSRHWKSLILPFPTSQPPLVPTINGQNLEIILHVKNFKERSRRRPQTDTGLSIAELGQSRLRSASHLILCQLGKRVLMFLPCWSGSIDQACDICTQQGATITKFCNYLLDSPD
ncbi:hypothetical protein M758_12G129700 [Ceratodon purpureus]|nr:hypothetical protein M758_12G129700 [Ceratodon purpureus]